MTDRTSNAQELPRDPENPNTQHHGGGLMAETMLQPKLDTVAQARSMSSTA